VAGHAGKPLTLARTRSPTFHWRAAAAAAAALLPPFLRLGAIGGSRRRYGSDEVNRIVKSVCNWTNWNCVEFAYGIERHWIEIMDRFEKKTECAEKTLIWRERERERERERFCVCKAQVVLRKREIDMSLVRWKLRCAWLSGLHWGGLTCA